MCVCVGRNVFRRWHAAPLDDGAGQAVPLGRLIFVCCPAAAADVCRSNPSGERARAREREASSATAL